MKWSAREPKRADMLRVRSGTLYHFGIYVSDGEVIQFGLPPAARPTVSEGELEVLSTDIDVFLDGGCLEVADFSWRERRRHKKADKVIEYARSQIGRRGYNLLHNNCEHFAYECLTGTPYSSQTKNLLGALRCGRVLDVYIARLPRRVRLGRIYPAERRAEIEAVKNGRVRLEKYAAWRLLEYALRQSFGATLSEVGAQKSEGGKWTCPLYSFSISHSAGYVAVAVSRAAVGVDIEGGMRRERLSLASRILTPEELASFEALLGEGERIDFLCRAWCAKEAAYKKCGEGVFSPSSINASAYTERIDTEGVRLFLAVAADSLDGLRIFKDVKIR